MGVSIANGRIVHASLDRTYRLLMDARPQAEEMGRAMQTGWMARHAAALIDAADLKGETAPEHPLVDAWTALLDADREIVRTGRRDPRNDFEFELWLFPMSSRRTLLVVNTERRAFLDWFDTLPFVHDHAYWDKSDPDEDVTRSAWRRRRLDWERAMPVWSAPSDRCLTMVMFNRNRPTPPKATDALRHIEDRAVRSVSHARVAHIDEVHRALIADETARNPDFKPSGLTTFFDAERKARSDEARRTEIIADVAARLRDIGVDDLSPSRG